MNCFSINQPMCHNRLAMMTMTATKITAFEAEAETNYLLHGLVPDRFTAGEARFDPLTNVWRVPVLLSYAVIGPVGQVGEVTIRGDSPKVLSHTSATEMLAAARVLYHQHRDAIEAPVP